MAGRWMMTSRHARRWSAAAVVVLAGAARGQAVFVPLGDLPGGGFNSNALAVSPDGRIVVGRGSPESGSEAFWWTLGSGMIGLGHAAGGDTGEAMGASADGSVVAGQGNATAAYMDALRWSGGSAVSLGFGPVESQAR